ncbi:MAG: nitrogen regulation protein NR(II) [Balneolaceae bacterium]
MENKIPSFLKSVRFGYLLGSSLIIILLLFGLFEIIELIILSDLSRNQIKWLHFSRGIITALVILFWASWTIWQYRDIYKTELEATEYKYMQLLEHASDAIITTTKDNIISSWNKGAELLFGWKSNEITGKHISVIIPNEGIRHDELEHLNKELEIHGHINNFETERLHKNGTKKLVQLSETAVRNNEGSIIGKTQILRDITDIKLKEQQYQHSERLASVGHMAAGVAHEIGNPLASISSLTQLLQRKTDDSFTQNQLKKILEQINRINIIVRDLVDFSRPSNKDFVDTQINDLIQSAIGLLKHDARCRNIKYKLDLDQNIPRINVVPDQLHQVLVNLLLNAADALENTKNPQVMIKTEADQSSVFLRICDNGSGIPEEIRDRIFEPFFTTKQTGSGTGLGLSVSHGIIKSMNGTITLSTKEGMGSCFKITLRKNSNS